MANNNNNSYEPEAERWTSEPRDMRRRDAPGCLKTVLAEMNPCQDWYLVSDTVTGRKLDVQHTFGPVGRYALLLKLLGTAFCLSTLVYSLIDATSSSSSSSSSETNNNNNNNGKAAWWWWFAYYSHWGMIFSGFYQILSFSNSLFSERITQPPERVTGCPKATWILFCLAVNANLVGVILYWVLVYNNPNDADAKESAINYLNIASHGGVALVVVLDGLLINRIPLRWMHFWVWVLLYNMLYITWTIIQSDLVLGLGSPNSNTSDEAGEADSDAIYTALSWSDNWQKALIYSVIIIFGISPAIYTLLWLLSLYGMTWLFCCWNDQRRYVDSHLDKIRNDEDKKRRKQAKDNKNNNTNVNTSSRIFDPNNEEGDLELEEVSIFASTASPQKQ